LPPVEAREEKGRDLVGKEVGEEFQRRITGEKKGGTEPSAMSGEVRERDTHNRGGIRIYIECGEDGKRTKNRARDASTK